LGKYFNIKELNVEPVTKSGEQKIEVKPENKLVEKHPQEKEIIKSIEKSKTSSSGGRDW
jgi:hypothetical protein